ncbi:hypothetical protein [Proteus sp. FME41]|uniref:hypothetical protein n=1 Tax=Proteus sp. FME41 TaxID=2742608 RepID=UPI001867624B|nr:hypothetical protein [Proteus sp. FME41]
MKKIKIGYYYIRIFWSPLGDDCNTDKYYLNLNLNNKESIYSIVENVLIPELNLFSYKVKLRIKESLKYAITYYSDEKLAGAYDKSPTFVKLPDNITVRDFYIFVWKSMYGEESYQALEKDFYIEIPLEDIYV